MLRQSFLNSYHFGNLWPEAIKLPPVVNRLGQELLSKAPLQMDSFPVVNIWGNGDSVVVVAKLPGVNPACLYASVMGDKLTLSGLRQPANTSQQVDYHHQETEYSRFTRTFQLPFAVDGESAEAVFKNGVLHLSLPQTEVAKSTRISTQFT
jgi:HSP20 family protein